MDGNPGEMPNPLNPNPDEQNLEQQNEPVMSEPVEVMAEEVVVSEPEPVVETTAPEPAEVVVEETTATVAPVATTTEAVKPKKKKTGLIVGMIVCFFIAAGCGVAALLFFLNNGSGDQVTAAINKIMSGEAPTNLAVDGTIDVIPSSDNDAPFSRLSIDLKADMVPNFKANSASATLNMYMKNGYEASIKFDEVYTADGDLFVRIDGIKNLMSQLTTLNSPQILDVEETNCITDESGMTNCSETSELYGIEGTGPLDYADMDGTESLLGLIGIGELIDGEWIRVSQAELALITSNATMDNNMVCMTNFIEDLGDYSNTMVDYYKKNPFVKSSRDNLGISNKQDTLYRISVDEKNLEGFISSVQSTKPMSDFFGCMGFENATVNIDNLAEEFENVPEIYVEVDNNNNFTRFYMDGNDTENDSKLKADFSLAYPSTINITEPLEYKSFIEIVQSLMANPGEVTTTENML